MFRRRKDQLQVFLVHPGGPYWKNKDAGAWSIPKGEHGEKEDPLDAAKREFEDGVAPKSGRQQEFSEVDRADWFSLGDARKRILKGQVGFLDRLIARFR